MNLEQLRKQAKELARAARAGDAGRRSRGSATCRSSSRARRLVLAREQGYASWPALVHELAEQPFRTDLEYYEGRADGIATVNGVVARRRRAATSRSGTGSRAGPS